MKSEEAVQIDHSTARNMDRWPHRVISRFGVWDHDVQAVGGATLEDNDQPLLIVSGRFVTQSCTTKERRNRGGTHDRHCTIAKESAPGDGHKLQLLYVPFVVKGYLKSRAPYKLI